jgi:hypothetical protein
MSYIIYLGPIFVAPGQLFNLVIRYHKKGLRKIANSSEQGWHLDVHRELKLIICMSISWLKVEQRLTSSPLVFMWAIDMMNAQSGLFELLVHSSDSHAYHTRHATRGHKRHTVLQRAMTTWNSIPHQVTDASSTFRFKKQIKNTSYGTAGAMKQQKHRHRHMHTHSHTLCVILLDTRKRDP